MNIMMFGPPGAGKGTFAQELCKKYKIPQIASGDLFREALKNKTELGLKAKGFMDKGELVPDDITIGLISERINKDDCKNGFILDGFPRTIEQADALKNITKIDIVLNLIVTDKIIIQRLSARVQCKECDAIFNLVNIPPKKAGICDHCGGELFQRDDDKEEAIKNRLVVYRKQSEPLIEKYRKEGILVDIDAEQELEDTVSDCIKEIDKKK